MLKCRDLAELSERLLSNELSWQERLQVRLHLAMCRHCRRFVRHLRLLVSALGMQRPTTPPEPGFVERVMDALPQPASED